MAQRNLMISCHKKDLKLSPFGQLIQFDFYTSSQIMEKLYPLQHHYNMLLLFDIAPYLLSQCYQFETSCQSLFIFLKM